LDARLAVGDDRGGQLDHPAGDRGPRAAAGRPRPGGGPVATVCSVLGVAAGAGVLGVAAGAGRCSASAADGV